ncbi:MAG: GNAT family N-acetyltransferase [Bacteroidetes bacterium]|nr:GNAT family N-acetyltransferase [Bacteroidota bacterium]
MPKPLNIRKEPAYMIRPPKPEEAQKLLNLKKAYLVNVDTIPMDISEYKNDLDAEKKLIRQYNSSSNSILLIAEKAGKFVGNIDLTGSPRKRMAHTGMIGMGILEDFRGEGIGRMLMQATLDWAKNDSPLELIWLEVYANNEAGLRLYKSFGFRESGTIKGFFKHGNTYYDKIEMYLHLR